MSAPGQSIVRCILVRRVTHRSSSVHGGCAWPMSPHTSGLGHQRVYVLCDVFRYDDIMQLTRPRCVCRVIVIYIVLLMTALSLSRDSLGCAAVSDAVTVAAAQVRYCKTRNHSGNSDAQIFRAARCSHSRRHTTTPRLASDWWCEHTWRARGSARVNETTRS